MQKRPFHPYKIDYLNIPLGDNFPILGGGIYFQGDKEITYLHYHNCLEIGYCHEGTGIFVVDNKVLPFRKGSISVISHNETHLAQSVVGTTSKWTWLYFDPARLIGGITDASISLSTENFNGSNFNNIITTREESFLRKLVLSIISELDEKKEGYQSCVRGLSLSLMVNLHRHYSKNKKRGATSQNIGSINRIGPALQLITNSYNQPLDISLMAKKCFLSETQFRRLFKQTMKQSPIRFLTNLRLQMAASLLSDPSRRIIEISEDIGYPTLSSFNRHFQKYLHMSPREWRKKIFKGTV